MGTRKRTNMHGLVSHTCGNKSKMSEESLLRKKFQNGNITKEELRKLASFMLLSRKPKIKAEITLSIKYIERDQYYIKCWDKWIPCTETQYNMASPCARKISKIQVKTW